MEKVYISKNYFGKNTAESKAKIDCEIIMESLGYHNRGLHRTTFQNRKISSVFTVLSSIIGRIRMPHDSIIIFQYPKSTIRQEIASAKKKNNKIIVIIHDLEAIRGLTESYDDRLDWARDVDVLIVHTQSMAEYVRNILPNKNIIILGIFDYLCEIATYPIVEQPPYKIAFAGNLTKSAFITEISPEHFEIFLFGIKKKNQKFNHNVIYQGLFSPEDLPKHLNSHFGLVWDGDINGNGSLGEYLKYISPHKLSMYISAGLPVIVKKDSAMADFVLSSEIGFAINCLTDLNSILLDFPFKNYIRMRSNVLKIQQSICKGSFMQEAIRNAENELI